jgi:hypothetical protein
MTVAKSVITLMLSAPANTVLYKTYHDYGANLSSELVAIINRFWLLREQIIRRLNERGFVGHNRRDQLT